jgi:hypothetical protein
MSWEPKVIADFEALKQIFGTLPETLKTEYEKLLSIGSVVHHPIDTESAQLAAAAQPIGIDEAIAAVNNSVAAEGGAAAGVKAIAAFKKAIEDLIEKQ